MDYLDWCLGYRELKGRNFNDEYSGKFEERRRFELEDFRYPIRRIDCVRREKNSEKKYHFFEQTYKAGGDEYNQIWAFKHQLTDLQFKKFLLEFNQEGRIGKEKYFFDEIGFMGEWVKSRFNGNEQLYYMFPEKDKSYNARFAIEKKDDDNFSVYWQYDDTDFKREYGKRDFSGVDVELFKDYISKKMESYSEEIWMFRSNILKKLIEEEIDGDLEIERFKRDEKKGGLECYGYNETGGEVRGKLFNERNLEDGIKKETYETREIRRLYILRREKDGRREKWIFKRDFTDYEAGEFLRQFDDWKERETRHRRENIKSRARG